MKKVYALVIMTLVLVGCDGTISNDKEVTNINQYEITLSDDARLTLVLDNEGVVIDCSKEDDNNSTTECSQGDIDEVSEKLDTTEQSLLAY